MPWDPTCYTKFKAERFAPFADLTALVSIKPSLRVLDLGCGTGELTRRLADMLPDSDVLGIDSSREMLDKSAAFARDGVRFEHRLIEDVAGEWDVVVSNAALHWVENHAELIPKLVGLLAPGGRLAVQLPSNHTHPAHRAVIEIASECPFREALNGWTRTSPVLSIEAYAELLFRAGGENVTVFEKVYPHVLENSDAVADWTSGTTLVPYFERLPESLHEPFQVRYRERLRELYPETPVFYGFRRTFFAADFRK
jgi:trans-aconitate 2-methyltransferase